MMKKPRNYATLTVPGSGVFECRCDGERLEARVNDGPWQWVALPPQPSEDEAGPPSGAASGKVEP